MDKLPEYHSAIVQRYKVNSAERANNLTIMFLNERGVGTKSYVDQQRKFVSMASFASTTLTSKVLQY